MDINDKLQLQRLLFGYRTAVRMESWAKRGTYAEQFWESEMNRLHQAIIDLSEEIGNKMWNAALEETA